MANIKEIQRLRGVDLAVAALGNMQIDAEIGKQSISGRKLLDQ